MAGPFWYKSGGWWRSGGEVQEGEVGVPGPSSWSATAPAPKHVICTPVTVAGDVAPLGISNTGRLYFS